ncbi:MAG: sodium:dicarboxylate symporter [Opitutaceae bacterium]|nr:sodium:dicarboxylate symporter [Opitutaceae bacterium]
MTELPWKKYGIYAGLAVFLVLVLFFNPEPDNPQVGKMGAIAALMAILWITEAVPLAVTALVPIVALPLFGILGGDDTAKAYMNSIVFLFIGGFMIAVSMQRWNLHRRIALTIIHTIGKRADFMVLGFMVSAASLSMWISNTATAVMMLPIGLAIVVKIEEEFGEAKSHKVTLALMLGIAYGCSVGGVATLVGTPTNLAFVEIFHKTFPQAPPIAFGQWLIIGLPYSLTMIFIIWLLLTKVLCRFDKGLVLDRSVIRQELKGLGPMSYEEKIVLSVFIVTALLWTFRKDLVLGYLTIPGWTNLHSAFELVNDGMIAICMAMLLFFISAHNKGVGDRILQSDTFGKIPWDIILLFSGGFALAEGFKASGLSQYIGDTLASIGVVNVLLLVVVICFCVTFLTELTSNVATLSMLLPILGSWAVAISVHPLLFAAAAAISSSMAFMMPVATPPNAVVFGSKRIRIIEMARTGLMLNFVAMFFTIVAVYLLFPYLTGDAISDFPAWAK